MSALETQEGGSHYKDLKIQPIEYVHANGIGFAEGNVIKYVTRWRAKGGLADLRKARHFIDLLIELEGGAVPPPMPSAVPAPDPRVRLDSLKPGEQFSHSPDVTQPGTHVWKVIGPSTDLGDKFVDAERERDGHVSNWQNDLLVYPVRA